MLAKLWHSPAVAGEGPADPVGTACIGSSEAIMLGGGWEGEGGGGGSEGVKGAREGEGARE